MIDLFENAGVSVDGASSPCWRELAKKSHIVTDDGRGFESDGEPWTAWLFFDRHAGMTSGTTEREAVVRLIQKLKLKGWNTLES